MPTQPLDEHWFTEICEECGSAFSMALEARLHAEQTPYQRIEILETASYGTVMVIDGFVMLTDRDNFIYHEMMTHPALFSHPAPGRVLIVGGGDCGSLREVLRHPEVGQVWQVDIDERVTRLAERYFPRLCEANADPRVRLHFEDALQWIGRAPQGSLDVIVVDSTDPIGPAEGLFGAAFYHDCWQALGAGGVLVHQSESPLFHAQSIIAPMRRALVEAGFGPPQTLLFPLPSYPSGWWSATLACKDSELRFLREPEARDRPFVTRYYSAAIHRSALALPGFLEQALD